MKNKHLGSSLDDFLKEEGIYEEVQERAIKKVIVYQILEAMKKQALTKVEMARRMNTSRSELDRVLDPENQAITLESLLKAATAVGKTINVRLVDAGLETVSR